jgi:hypothetical protein
VSAVATLPVTRLDAVWHVGTLDPADKAAMYAASYEGAGLSVSDCPAAWERIARLGGRPWWRLERPGGTFLDAHALDQAQRAAILDWGRQRGYVADRTVFEVVWHDDELERDVALWCDDADDAADEAEAAGADPDDVETITVPAATTALRAAASQPASDQPEHALDLLLPVWAEHTTDLDGVWWHDLHDPATYTAPRGVIIASRVERWTPHPSDRADAPDPDDP